MFKITAQPRNRVLLAIGGYIALTVLVTLLSSALLPSSANSLGVKFIFALCGPVLALGTHMSIFLWIPLSFPLVGLLVISALYEKARILAMIAFVVSWLAIGWYLKDLF